MEPFQLFLYVVQQSPFRDLKPLILMKQQSFFLFRVALFRHDGQQRRDGVVAREGRYLGGGQRAVVQAHVVNLDFVGVRGIGSSADAKSVWRLERAAQSIGLDIVSEFFSV